MLIPWVWWPFYCPSHPLQFGLVRLQAGMTINKRQNLSMVKTELRIVSLSCKQLPSFYLEYKSNSKYLLRDQLRLGTELNPMERFRDQHWQIWTWNLNSWQTGDTLLMGDWLSEFIRTGRDTDVGWIHWNSLGVLDSSSDMWLPSSCRSVSVHYPGSPQIDPTIITMINHPWHQFEYPFNQ